MSAPAQWILGVASVVFDIDVGQRVDCLVPEGCLTDNEMQSCAFHCFPDSMSMELHAKTSIRDTSFYFRVKRDNKEGSTDLHPAFIYGFVFCRQRQDESLRRGGEQMSVVVLSEHPFTTALRPLSQVAGSMFFSMGKQALQQVYNEVCAWPAPTAGHLLQLQVGFSTLSCRLPSFATLPHPSCCTAIDVGTPILRSGSSSRHASRTTSRMENLSADQLIGRTGSSSSAAHMSGDFSRLTLNRSPPGSGADLGQGLGDLAGPASQHTRLPVGSPGGSNGGVSDLAPAQLLMTSSRIIPAASTDSAAEAVGSLLRGESGSKQAPLGSCGLLSNGSIGSAGSLSMEALPGLPPASPVVGSSTAHQQSGNSAGQAVYRRVSLGAADMASVLGPFSDADIFTPFQPNLNKLWHLWELVLLGKPLMVVAPSPADCAGAVAALISLISPMPYAQDFRPYYTIHDPHFGLLANGALPGADAALPCLIGITNLYFIRALGAWPHILSVGRKDGGGSTWPASNPSQSSMSSWLSGSGSGLTRSTSLFTPSGAVMAFRQRAQGAQALLSTHIEALWSGYKPVTRPDQAFLTRLLVSKPGDIMSKQSRIAFVNSEAIRRHFSDLTTALLAPFNRYLEPGADGRVPTFNEDEFLFVMRTLPLTSHSQLLLDRVGNNAAALVELYSRLLTSPNFRSWFALARAPVAHLIVLPVVGAAHSQANRSGNVALQRAEGHHAVSGLSWFPKARQHLDEVNLINLFFDLEGQLHEAQAEALEDDAPEEAGITVSRLEREFVTLFLGIGQQDLQLICISAPQRREMLMKAAKKAASKEQYEAVEKLCLQLQ